MNNHRNWQYHSPNPVLVEDLAKNDLLYGIPFSVIEICVRRGYTTAQQILEILTMNEQHHAPFDLFKDASIALSLLNQAYEEKWEVVLHSDYDSDGVHGAVVGVEGFRQAGLNIHAYTNNRLTQGYGLQPSSVDEILALYPNTRLLMTCDNGIMAYEGVAYAKAKGLMVIVTDHHEPSEKLPEADAIIDAKQVDCTYPFKELCGTGVMYKLVEAFYLSNGLSTKPLRPLLEMVAVATVGDIVPLIGENRLFVKKGLARLNQPTCHPMYRFMKEVNEVNEVTADFTIGFIFVPMINAISRLTGNVQPIIEAFLSNNEDEQRTMVETLKAMNEKRKKMTQEQMEVALAMIESKTTLPPVLVVAHESFHEGIIGLIAGRLKEMFHRPVFAFAPTEKGTYKGSGRSIDGFSIKKAFDDERLTPHLIQAGGHYKAGGLTIGLHQLDDFTKAVQQIGDDWLDPSDFIPTDVIDYIITEDELTFSLVDELRLLEPFGEGFAKPNVVLKDVEVEKVQYLGKEKNHLKLSNPTTTVLVWNGAESYQAQQEPRQIDVCGYPQFNIFNQVTSIQFVANQENYKPSKA